MPRVLRAHAIILLLATMPSRQLAGQVAPHYVPPRPDMGCFSMQWQPPATADSTPPLPQLVRLLPGPPPKDFVVFDVHPNAFAPAIFLGAANAIVLRGSWSGDSTRFSVYAGIITFDATVQGDSATGRGWARAWGVDNSIMKWGSVALHRAQCP